MHLIASGAEFVGTFMFLLFAFGGTNVANTFPDSDAPARLLYISLSFGMSLAVNAWIFFRVSGGMLNPAVTLAMVLTGAIDVVRGALVTVAQVLGGIAAAAVVDGLTPGPLRVTTSLGGGASVAQGLFIEAFLTAQLVLTIFFLAGEKHRGTFVAPLGIGLSLFIAELTGVYYTGGSLNPARSFGPAVVAGFDKDHWIYWVGPILGSLLATGFYRLLKAFNYETVNPGQDGAGDAPIQDMALVMAKTDLRPLTGGSAPTDDMHKFGSTTRSTTANASEKPNESFAKAPDMEAGAGR